MFCDKVKQMHIDLLEIATHWKFRISNFLKGTIKHGIFILHRMPMAVERRESELKFFKVQFSF